MTEKERDLYNSFTRKSAIHPMMRPAIPSFLLIFVAPSSLVLVVFVAPGQFLGPAVAPDDAIFVAALLERWQAPVAQKEK